MHPGMRTGLFGRAKRVPTLGIAISGDRRQSDVELNRDRLARSTARPPVAANPAGYAAWGQCAAPRLV